MLNKRMKLDGIWYLYMVDYDETIKKHSNLNSLYMRFGKRSFDFLGALILLPFFLLILPFIGLAIKIGSRGSIIFKQTRVGRLERPFTIYKFRTMTAGSDETLHTMMEKDAFVQAKDNCRITHVGYYLRKFSLDELPQLINILKGDMSFIGPRPFVKEDHDMISSKHIIRLAVRPGITGLAQVKGRSEATLTEREHYDLRYINGVGLHMDIDIIKKTFVVLFKGI